MLHASPALGAWGSSTARHAEGIKTRNRLIDNEMRVLKEEANRLNLELSGLKDRVKENKEKIKLNNQLPYLVANIVEVLEVWCWSCPPQVCCHVWPWKAAGTERRALQATLTALQSTLVCMALAHVCCAARQLHAASELVSHHSLCADEA